MPVAQPVTLPSTYRAIVIESQGHLKLVTKPLVLPGADQVLVKVVSCGLCHTDTMAVQSMDPRVKSGVVPGHEVVGHVVAVGNEVTRFKVGDRVGRGYHGGQCFQCDPCSGGQFFACNAGPGPTGLMNDGGYAEYMLAPHESLARITEGLDLNTAGPLMCAGVTVFNALRNSGAVAGDVVAVQGLGGLGHLGVQYARHMGFKTVAISTGSRKLELAKKLGAHAYIDTSAQDVAAELQKLGGARVIIATSFDAASQSALVGGLGVNGELISVGVAAKPLSVSGLDLLMKRASVKGWYGGVAKDAEETATFSALAGIKVMTESYPLEKFQEAYDRMTSGNALFRVVLAIHPETSSA